MTIIWSRSLHHPWNPPEIQDDSQALHRKTTAPAKFSYRLSRVTACILFDLKLNT